MQEWMRTRKKRQSISTGVKIFWKATCSADSLLRSYFNNIIVLNGLARTHSRKSVCLASYYTVSSPFSQAPMSVRCYSWIFLFTLRHNLFMRYFLQKVEEGWSKGVSHSPPCLKITDICVCLRMSYFLYSVSVWPKDLFPHFRVEKWSREASSLLGTTNNLLFLWEKKLSLSHSLMYFQVLIWYTQQMVKNILLNGCMKERVNKYMNDRSRTQTQFFWIPQSAYFPTTILCYLHLYISQRRSRGFEKCWGVSLGKLVLYDTLSILGRMWACDLGKRWWEKMEVGLLSWESRNHIFK